MGCCASTPDSSHDSPYNNASSANATSSSRAINTAHSSTHQAQQPQSQPRPSTASSLPRARHGSRSTARVQTQSLSDHVNQPLRLHIWKTTKTSSRRKWTRSEIDNERIAFFDTRVTGKPEIWQVLGNTCEMIWMNTRGVVRASGSGSGSGASRKKELKEQMRETLESAGVMLLAAEVTVPTGDLADGVYDILGGFYELPEWVVADPEDLVFDAENSESLVSDEADKKLAFGDAIEGDGNDDESVKKRREEKGKTVLVEQDLIKVVVKMTEGPEKVVVKVGKDDSARSVGMRVLEDAGLSGKSIKLLYMGRILKENESLIAQNWKQDHAINAFVFEAT